MDIDKFFEETNFDAVENKVEEELEKKMKEQLEEAKMLEHNSDECEGGACKI